MPSCVKYTANSDGLVQQIHRNDNGNDGIVNSVFDCWNESDLIEFNTQTDGSHRGLVRAPAKRLS